MKKNKLASNRLWRMTSFCVLTALAVFAATSVSAQTIIYNNGNIATGTVSNNGTVAPAGSQWAEIQNNQGNNTQTNTSAGSSCYLGTGSTQFRCADDFTVPAGQTWTINDVLIYGYQTGFTGTTGGPFTGAVLQIWNGRPGDAGSTVIFGDLTTNRLGTVVNTQIFRLFNSSVPAPGSPPGTTRRVWEARVNVSPAQVLTAGTYWIEWRFQNAASGALFFPTVTEEGTRGVPGANARQFVGSTSTWQDAIDDGNPTSSPDVVQAFPFKLVGARSQGGNPIYPPSRELDFNGDNISDPTIVRSASPSSQSTWFININGTLKTAVWGLGVGQTNGDVATPADFDGDGVTDVAVWRSGTQGYFHILQSNTNTYRGAPFGQTGDIPTVVGDYDGDGKADPAVYRDGSPGFFAYRGSLNNPSNGITVVFWGQTGDKPVAGDFDGDRKADFHVARNNGGTLTHYQMLSGGGTNYFVFGSSTDRLVPGQFDTDGKTDIAAVRSEGGAYKWYILRSWTGLIKYVTFGNPATDTIATGDYDGDLETDISVWSTGSQANFFVVDSNRGPVNYFWGTTNDYPAANYDVF